MEATPSPPAEPAAQPNAATSGKLFNLLVQMAGVAVLVTFVLYAIGFVIWRSYLSTYGVSSVAFIQSDYIAGAVCYLLVSLVIGLPPAILFEHWRLSRAGKKPKEDPMNVLKGIWFVILIWLQTVFFPNARTSPSKFFWGLLGFAALWIVLYIVWNLKWPQAPLAKFLRVTDVKLNLFFVIVAISLFLGTGVNTGYLFYTVFLYPLFVYLPGTQNPTPESWAKSNLPVRVVLFSFAGLLVLIHVQVFGKAVFGDIPKHIGGGKPEKALIYLAPQHASLAAPLNFSTTNQTFLTNGIVGPVGIILRSDKEIIFVDYVQIGAADMLTNIVTNAVQRFATNQAQVITTNTTFSMTTNVMKNPIKAERAKQVNALVVDAVVFSD